jgi:hypothetical protein
MLECEAIIRAQEWFCSAVHRVVFKGSKLCGEHLKQTAAAPIAAQVVLQAESRIIHDSTTIRSESFVG